MVDALRHARQWVTREGSVIDVHPTATPAWLEIGDQSMGTLDAGDATARHARATAAVEAALHEGLFTEAAAVDFVFHTYGDSIDELRDYIVTHWRSTRMGDHLIESARLRIRAHPHDRPCVVEQIRLTHLRVRD